MALAYEARQIRKSFGGVEALHGVDLNTTGGSVLALLGENGAGKSTLVKIMAGDYRPDSGSLMVDGESHDALLELLGDDGHPQFLGVGHESGQKLWLLRSERDRGPTAGILRQYLSSNAQLRLEDTE